MIAKVHQEIHRKFDFEDCHIEREGLLDTALVFSAVGAVDHCDGGNSRDEWERTFNICWGGVYNCTRAFLPMLQNAEEGHIVNTSSINGFWASVGPRIPHTAYSAAKFAVKGFSEALITDLRINAPHIKCSVVMPGQIGTSIRANTRKMHSGDREFGRDRCCRSCAGARALCFVGP